MQIIKLEASVRSQMGKTPARRVRREGKVPAVAYGKGLPTRSIAVNPKGLVEVLSSEHGKNTVVELGIGEDGTQEKITALLREYTVHPVTRELLHADFVQIKLDEPADFEVPFACTGKPAGVVLGGILRQVYRKLPVRCLPEQVPVSITHDVTPLELGDHVKASELALPPGVTLLLPPDRTVAGVVAPEKDRTEEAAPGAAAATAEGAAAAPAAGAAAAAPAKEGDKKEAAKKEAAPAKDEKKKK